MGSLADNVWFGKPFTASGEALTASIISVTVGWMWG